MAGMHGIVRRRVAGFTLAEILVAVTILTTVLSGVALLFTQSLRTVRIGFQARDAFELARGTISVIERDLARAYVASQRGDASTFYGTPLGFTFIGLVGTRESPGHNLARITYVLHRSVGSNTGSQALTTDSREPAKKYSGRPSRSCVSSNRAPKTSIRFRSSGATNSTASLPWN